MLLIPACAHRATANSPAPATRAPDMLRPSLVAHAPADGHPTPTPLTSPAPAATKAVSSPVARGPRILSVVTSPDVVHDGDVVHWTVRTSPDVVSVSAVVLSYTFALQRRHPGSFALVFNVPQGVPSFLHRTYDLAVVARTASGATVTRTVRVTFA